MESGQTKEEIIELTEVAEDGPAPSWKKDSNQPLPQNATKKEAVPLPLSTPNQIPSPSHDPGLRVEKAAMAELARDWAANEGNRILERMAQEYIPRIAQSRLDPEIEKLKTELSAVRAQGEGLSARVEQWLQKEGAGLVERLFQENVPRLVAEQLRPDRERVQKELEDLQTQRESLSAKIDQWLQAEGVKSLEQSTGEAIPRIVGERLKPEVETLKGELEKVRLQADEERMRVVNWFEKEGREILENTARETFPRIAADVLRQEIARLKDEAGAEEKE
jgi:hypothetical protein